METYIAGALSVVLFLGWMLAGMRRRELQPITTTEWRERMRNIGLGVK